MLPLLLALALLATGGFILHRRLSSVPDPIVIPTEVSKTPKPSTKSSASKTPSATPEKTASLSPKSTPTPSATPTPDLEQKAVETLKLFREADLPSLSLSGQPAAMLGGKWVGVTDPALFTRSGSHTFGAVDILYEHSRIRAEQSSSSVKILLVYGSDFGDRLDHDGKPIYVTLATSSWSSREEVLSWCKSKFPGIPDAERNNLCTPTVLK
ncbi:MAG: hypothetical protein ACRDAX_08835 [Propionibacteriaceae bacterium]